MVKKISGYFSLNTLNESKHKKGFVTNGSRRKTRQGTQAALMGMSATVGSGSTAYDAFRKENQDENEEDEFKIGKMFICWLFPFLLTNISIYFKSLVTQKVRQK